MAKRDEAMPVLYETEGRQFLLRALKKTTEALIAEEIGVAQQQVSSWKRGKSRPKPEYREALARVIGAPIGSWYTSAERAIARGKRRPSTPPPGRTGTDG